MSTPNHDPSLEHEPHLRKGPFAPDASEAAAQRALRRAEGGQDEDDGVEHSVWDEPALSRPLAGATPSGSLTYAGWLDKRIAQTGPWRCWAVAVAVAIAAGPWAILGALMSTLTVGSQSVFGIVMVIILAPVTEEMMKVAAALWVVEKRPFLFCSRLQIAFCALAGGAVFAAVENLLYLNVYISDPSPWLIQWRWTVCVAMHVGCSAVAGVGLMRIWHQAIQQRSPPQLARGAPFLVAAMIMHGAYNSFAVVLEMLEYDF